MTKTRYAATHPQSGEIVSILTARVLRWATWGYETKTATWTHLGWSVSASQTQAESSARSTGPYFDKWQATLVIPA
jgi:hypothetical protein